MDGVAENDVAVLQRIEDFVVAGQRWLKIAGGAKADVLELALAQRPPASAEVCIEFGCFVGYTAVRLAGRCFTPGHGLRLVSCEFEAVHVCVARHALALARLPCAEVWPAHIPLATPRLVEQLGERAVAFKFMDHKGTRFHEDRRHFDALGLYAPCATVLCDNVVHPGAPEYLWAERDRPNHQSYALREFAQVDDLEDWQSLLQIA